MNEIKVSTENVQKAFHAAGENPAIRELLINLFGKENVEPEQSKDVRERVKTFEDACKELGEEHLFVKQYNSNELADIDTDLDSYLKLRIICAALNEGWEPQFIKDEYRWYPWFYLYAQEEIDKKNDEWKQKRHLISTGDFHTGYDGFAFVSSDYVPSLANSNIGSRLCLKSEALATYCGTHFIQLWADFNLIRKYQ